MDHVAAIAFALGLTGVPETSQYYEVMKPRVVAAATATHQMLTDGYQFNGKKIVFEPLFDVTETRTRAQALEMTEKLALAIEFHESSFDPMAVNDAEDCGLMQTKPWWIYKFTRSNCYEVRHNIKLGIFVGMETLRYKRDECLKDLSPEKRSTVTSLYWLGAYASGKCGGAQKTARQLCAPAGVCDAL